jgi:hypothetical protein
MLEMCNLAILEVKVCCLNVDIYNTTLQKPTDEKCNILAVTFGFVLDYIISIHVFFFIVCSDDNFMHALLPS